MAAYARQGRHFSARGISAHPRPVQQPHPPIWIGGNGARARQRVCDHGTGWNPGEYAYILNEYTKRNTSWKDAITEWLDDPEPKDLTRGHEYAASAGSRSRTAGRPAWWLNSQRTGIPSTN